MTRTIYRRCALSGYEEKVAMKDLAEGDTFRIVTEDPEDILHGKGIVLYTATSDGYKNADGIWAVAVDMLCATFEEKTND